MMAGMGWQVAGGRGGQVTGVGARVGLGTSVGLSAGRREQHAFCKRPE